MWVSCGLTVIVDHTGDELMAVFEGPVNAVRAAQRIQARAGELNLRARAGVHIGEVVERNGALRGIAVDLAARVMARARAAARCSYPRQSRTSSPAPPYASKTADNTSSKASKVADDCMRRPD